MQDTEIEQQNEIPQNPDDAWKAISDSFYIEPREKPHPSAALSSYVKNKDTLAEPEPVPPHIREADHLYNDPFKVLSDYNFRPRLIPLAYSHGHRRSTIKEESDETSDAASSHSPSDGHALSKTPNSYSSSPTVTSDGSVDANKTFFNGLLNLGGPRSRNMSDARANTDSPKDSLPLSIPSRKLSTADTLTPGKKTKEKKVSSRSRSKVGSATTPLNLTQTTEETVEENKTCLAYRATNSIENKSNDDIEKISTELLSSEDVYEEEKRSSKRLVSYHQPNFGWKPAHSTLCYRNFLKSYPEPRYVLCE